VGFNGYTFKSGKVVDLGSKMEKIITNERLRKNMAFNSSIFIRSYTPKRTVDKFSNAVLDLFENKNTKISFHKLKIKNLITVIIPVYKDKIGLDKTIESLGCQKLKGFKMEIIVAEDKFASGSYKTRNRALSHAKGEYVAFIDAGSTAPDNWLIKGSQDLKVYDYVGGPIEVVGGGSFQRNREFPVKEFMRDLHFAPTTNLFVKRSLIEKIGGFDQRLKSSGDLEFGDRVYRSRIFRQYFDPKVIIMHPARNFKNLIFKQKRLAQGFVDLGRFYPKRFPDARFNIFISFAKMIFPPVWLISKSSWRRLSLVDKIKVFLTTYFFSFVQHGYTIQYVLLRK
jgi:glycosyltransferase involved in cell wall biosynthesis